MNFISNAPKLKVIERKMKYLKLIYKYFCLLVARMVFEKNIQGFEQEFICTFSTQREYLFSNHPKGE